MRKKAISLIWVVKNKKQCFKLLLDQTRTLLLRVYYCLPGRARKLRKKRLSWEKLIPRPWFALFSVLFTRKRLKVKVSNVVFGAMLLKD